MKMNLSRDKLMLAMARECNNDKELCAKAGLASVTFTQVKSGRCSPKPATLGKIARALGVEPEELIEGEV
jgi:transcriptional regulator with XRE-family HTH domain